MSSEGVIDRLMVFCPMISENYTTDELILSCAHCHRFFALCCSHTHNSTRNREATIICHNFRLVFTDGSCLDNGKSGARSGVGIAIGRQGDRTDQWSIPVDDDLDPNGRRSSQRAELLGALEGLRLISEEDGCELGKIEERHGLNPTCWVIVTDSEYVVKGMTEWLPIWKNNGWRNAKGSRPSNLDLFMQLDALIEEKEHAFGVNVGFWHVERQYNQIADGLAKSAARSVGNGL